MPTKVFTLADLRVLLAPLSSVRRAAITFTLDARGTIFDTVMLGYVFWEYMDDGQAVPLFGLEQTVIEATCGGTFTELQAV